MHAGRSLPLLRKRHWRSSRVATYLRVIIWGPVIVLDFKAVLSSRSCSFGGRKCVDLADLAKRAMHADRKVSGSKDEGGAWDSLDRVTFAAFDGSLVHSRGIMG